MDYKITIRVQSEEKVIDIDWEDIRHDYTMFIRGITEPKERNPYMRIFKIVTSRIKNVFLDRCTKSIIQ